MKMA
jgi:hypothetical protein